MIAVGLASGLGWISDRVFGIALLLIWSVVIATSIYAGMRGLSQRRARGIGKEEANPGGVLDDTSRKHLERLIHSAKFSVICLAIGLVGASVSDFPVNVKMIGGTIAVGIIAMHIRYIMRLRKLLEARLVTKGSNFGGR